MESEPVVAVGAIISEIPAVDKLEKNPVVFLQTGMRVRVNGNESTVEVLD